MTSKNESILPFVLGAGVGAVIALLLSPKTGEDLRQNIADGVSGGGRQLAAGGRKLKQQVGKIAADAQDQVREAVAAGQDAYDEARNT